MKEELQNQLYEKYPKIFIQKNWDKQKTCMCWGICCGDGWYKLLDELCGYLQFHTDHNGRPQIEAKQVKEKFGGLRFYAIADDYQRGAIRFAEQLSLSICEACGSMEDVSSSTKGYVRTRCRKCIESEKR